MDLERLAERQKLVENTEGPVDCADPVSQMKAEWSGSWVSPIDDHVNRETWRRILAAHIQPLADAAD
jgi:hypothetical protein